MLFEVILAGLLFVEAGYILVGGIISGRWMWALVFGIGAGYAGIDWLLTRGKVGEEASAVADRPTIICCCCART
jgi:hypothetical protein